MPGSQYPNFGPLPEFDNNARLQELSVRALAALLKRDQLLLLRDQRFHDYGVDASFEALLDCRATNCIAQIQLKAVTSVTQRQDGVVTKSVEVSNLNYLLYGSSAIYILYDMTSDSFWYTWAAEERGRLDRMNPNWMEQASVTLEFSALLEERAVATIHERILREARARRAVSDCLSTASLAEEVNFKIDKKSLAVTTADEAYRIISNAGFSFVTDGWANEVLSLSGLLSTNQRAEAKIAATISYAHYALGDFFHALGDAGKALTASPPLHKSERDALCDIVDASKYHLGRLTLNQLVENQEIRAKAASGAVAILHEIEAKRFQILGRHADEEMSRRRSELSELVRLVERDASVSVALKLQARLHALYAEGWIIQSRFSSALAQHAIREKMKVEWLPDSTTEVGEAARDAERWETEIAKAISAAAELGIPLLLAEALRTRLLVRCSYLRAAKFLAKRFGIGDMPSNSDIEILEKEAQIVELHFERAGHTSGKLDVRMIIAELYEVMQRSNEARRIATKVEPIAAALGYEKTASDARNLLSGESIWQKLEREADASDTQDQDEMMAAKSDEDLERYAEIGLKTQGLGLDRKPFLLQDFKAYRLGASCRLNWCRHLQLLQNLFHTHHPQTAYAGPCKYVGKCAKHKFESIQERESAADTLEHFKQVFCRDCLDRRPKNGPQSPVAALT